MDSKTVNPNSVLIRLARTMGYKLLISNELILTEVPEVASWNRFARSIFYCKCAVCKKKQVEFSVCS